MKISGTIICQNEDTLIEKCIEQLNWVDEIVVIDGGSVDKTLDILKSIKEKDKRVQVYKVPFNGHFGDQKNIAIMKCSGDWIFNLDADELLEPELQKELIEIAKENKVELVRIPRHNFIDSSYQDGAYPDYQSRFFRSFCRYIYPVHEELVGWRTKTEAKHHIIHQKSAGRYNQQQNLYKKLVLEKKNQLRFIE